MNIDIADIKYSYEEFNESQKTTLLINLVYGDINDIYTEKTIICNRKGIIKTSKLSLNMIFAFQQQFKELKTENGKMNILIKKGNDSIRLESNQQLKTYFKDLINEIKNVGNILYITYLLLAF